MGLHHETTHGRVLRDADALEHLALHRRDSHGNKIALNYIPPEYASSSAAVLATPVAAAKENNNVGVKTVESIVYVTLSASFTGTVAGYTTLSGPPSANTASAASTDSASQAKAAAATSATSQGGTSGPSAATSSTAINNKSLFLNAPTSAVAASATAVIGGGVQQSGTATIIGGSPLAATRAPSDQISQDSSGMSGGAKAGLAFGIIIALALVGGLLFFCWRRRKNNAHHYQLDEKHTSSIFGGRSIIAARADRTSAFSDRVPASIRSTRTTSTAPRLSLRPVTQFFPNLADNRKSNGNALAVSGAAMSEKQRNVRERRPNENPFADTTMHSDKQLPPQNPFEEPERQSQDGRKSPSFKSATSGTHSPKSSWEASNSKSANLGLAAAVPVAVAGTGSMSPKPPGPNNVHRVQLDFKPSMDDELELISGQLVRMLHEYDDGWALCIRMDRSQQGVAPRTCLSKMPVKPRQGPPPQGPDGRPLTPNMGLQQQDRRPPAQGELTPRPLTPGSREHAAGMQQSQFATGMLARKPVPGQAM